MINICILMGKIVSDPRVMIIPQLDDHGNQYQKEYVYLDIELSDHYYNEVQQSSTKDIQRITVRFHQPNQIGVAKKMRKGHVLEVLSKIRSYRTRDQNQLWQEKSIFDVGTYRIFDDFRFLSKTATTFDQTIRNTITGFLQDALMNKDWAIVETCLNALKNIGTNG